MWKLPIHACLEYESAEAFLVDFESKLKTQIKLRTQYHQNCEQWQNRRPSLKSSTIKEEFLKWQTECPNSPKDTFDLAGIEWERTDFAFRTLERSDRFNESYELPEVYELNEWWEKHKGEVIP